MSRILLLAIALGGLLAPPADAATPIAAPATTPAAPGPASSARLTREQMLAGIEGPGEFLVVWGTHRADQRAVLESAARAMARRLSGSDSVPALPDQQVTEALLRSRSVVLFGGPAQNLWSARFASGLPVQFTATGFRWQDRLYDRPGDALHLVYPSPLDPRHFVVLIAANSPAALGRRAAALAVGGDDWRIFRDGDLVRSGRFSQSAAAPWRYDPALDRDRERERERFAAGLILERIDRVELRAPRGAPAARLRPLAGPLVARLAALGLDAPKDPPLRAVLYTSLEQKGSLTRDTHPEALDADNISRMALPAGRTEPDLWSLAAQRLVARGASRTSPWLEPAGVWIAGRTGGERLERAVARVYFARLLPTAADAAVRGAWRSPLIETPARALLTGALLEVAGSGRSAALLAWLGAAPPGTLDSLCRLANVPPRRVAERYTALADSLSRAGRSVRTPPRAAWRPADGFMRGVCLAHAVSLEHGYLSAECDRQLALLAAMGANWVSLTPFGYVPASGEPEIVSGSDGGPDEENDASIVEAAAHAHARGLEVWLKPHLWTRGWVGDLDFGPSGWPRFLDRYRAFLVHYALLADREGIEGLSVGHELAGCSRTYADRWRALIGDVRRVYTGSLTYDANWDEAESVSFWDALDVIGVSFYRPLSAAATRDPTALRAGATKALKALEPLARRWRRPVLLVELGYPPTPDAAVRPWDERGGALDVETQRACYEAVVRAMEPLDWLAGAFWWKWFTGGDENGATDPSYSPRGKPAEAVLRASLAQWRSRPVRVPAPGLFGK